MEKKLLLVRPVENLIFLTASSSLTLDITIFDRTKSQLKISTVSTS